MKDAPNKRPADMSSAGANKKADDDGGPPTVHTSSHIPSPDIDADAVSSSSNAAAGVASASNGRRRTFKVIVIGDSGVGKTCLTFRFCAGHFPGSTEATIGVDFREKILHVDNEDIRLQLWDTAGQERFRRSMVSHYYRNVSAVVLVYDVTRRSSFDALKTWVKECAEHGLVGNVPMIVVGNKFEDGLRPTVGTNDAQRFADDHGMPLFETSAKDDSKSDHVEAIFMTLAHKIRQAKPLLAVATVGDPSSSPSSSSSPTVRPGRRIVYQNDGYRQEQQSGGLCCS